MERPATESALVTFLDLRKFARLHPAPEPNSGFHDIVELEGRRYAGEAISAAVEALDDEALHMALTFPGDILIHNNVWGAAEAGGYLTLSRVLDICGSGALKARLRDLDIS